MDIAGLSMSMSQASLQQEVSLAVTKLAMNDNKEMMAGTSEMLSTMAVDPTRGQKIDVTV